MRPFTSLTLEAMIDLASQTFAPVPDPRAPERVAYSLHDPLMRGVAMMFFQYLTLLAFQRKMKQRRHRCNLEPLFGVHDVPSATQMRDILDGVPVELLRALWPALLDKIRRAGWAKEFATELSSGSTPGPYYPVRLDGSASFHSTRLRCPGCLEPHDSSGHVHCRHTVVSGTLVTAGSHRVLPLEVEEVRNDDGQAKQDCEIKAAKRFIPRLRQAPPRLPVVIGGDALYCHEPFVLPLRAHRMHHVLVCKPGAHPEVYREVEAQDARGALARGQWHEGPAGRRRCSPYRCARGVALTGAGRVRGTFLEVWSHNRSGQQRYHNAWFTDLDVTAENGAAIVGIGRSRWKIEKEQFNGQKHHGYALMPNYGPGQQTLSMVVYVLNLLAFMAHMSLERSDRLSQRCLATTSRRELWHTWRTAMRMILVSSWSQMLLISLDEEEQGP